MFDVYPTLDSLLMSPDKAKGFSSSPLRRWMLNVECSMFILPLTPYSCLLTKPKASYLYFDVECSMFDVIWTISLLHFPYAIDSLYFPLMSSSSGSLSVSHNQPTDELLSLLGDCIAGSRDAWHTFFGSVSPLLYGMLRNAGASHHVAEDIIGDLFVRLMEEKAYRLREASFYLH